PLHFFGTAGRFFSVWTMAHLVTPVDIPGLVKDFQKIVVDLKESDKINRSLSYAHRVADVIQRRCGDAAMRHIPGQDFEEHKKNRNRQLRDLDNENRQLRQLYEDSQWTLHLVMEAHRRLMEATFGKDNDFAESGRQSEDEVENLKQEFYVNAVRMAKAVHDVFEHEKKMSGKIQKRMEELRVENDILRCILDSESGADIQSIYDRLENKTPKHSPRSSRDDSNQSPHGFENSISQDQEATPRKKTSVIFNPNV
ncbi:hypothetical protein GCK32_002559, partial [Trichostrongylus colubriformis]